MTSDDEIRRTETKYINLFWDEQSDEDGKIQKHEVALNDDPLVLKSKIAIIISLPCIVNIWISETAVREDP